MEAKALQWAPELMKDQARTVHPQQRHFHDMEKRVYRLTHKQTILAEEICENRRHGVECTDRRILGIVACLPRVIAEN